MSPPVSQIVVVDRTVTWSWRPFPPVVCSDLLDIFQCFLFLTELGVNTFAPSTDTSLNMALENQSPQLRKNVMAATVSAFAMPTIAGTLSTTLATTAIPATLATSAGAATYLSPDLAKNPAVLGGLFLAHWFATNIVLQKFKDVKEL